MCYLVVVVVKYEEVLSYSVVEELEVEHYLPEFYSYYFVSVCSRFQAKLVIFCSVVVDIEFLFSIPFITSLVYPILQGFIPSINMHFIFIYLLKDRGCSQGYLHCDIVGDLLVMASNNCNLQSTSFLQAYQ